MIADVQALLAANPYPGLRSFEPEESDRFFGRREQIESLADRLATVRLVAVSGASGCGKSSLVKAGLLAELQRRSAAGTGAAWRDLVMRPGDRPIAHLAARLAAALEAAPGSVPSAQRVDSLHGQLLQGGLSLVEIVEDAGLAAGTRLLVIVDQFEEIFRMRRLAATDEAAAFVKLLLQSAQHPTAPVSVILTLRSDTLGGCAEFPGLPEAVSAGSYLVPRQTRAQRKEAIVEPAKRRDCKVAPRLVQRLLNDVSDDYDDLPVMQHALSRTWAHWARRGRPDEPIDLDDYHAVGGAEQALSRHADDAWTDLDPAREAGGPVERVFRALTERERGGLELRRPVPLRELCAACDDGRPDAAAQVRAVVDRFRRPDTAFLTPVGAGPLADDAVIDISHESLIRQWASLRTWLDREAESARVYARVAMAAAEGQRLWRQPELGMALQWRAQQRPNAAWAARYPGDPPQRRHDFVQAMNFLDDSAEAERGANERRLRHRRRWALAGALCGLAVVMVLLGWTAGEFQRRAEQDSALRTLGENQAFFEQLLAAAHERQARSDAWRPVDSEACKRAFKLADGVAWREMQHKDVCVGLWGDGTVDGVSEIRRLEANIKIAQGDIGSAQAQIQLLQGRQAIRAFVQLNRLADLNFDGLRREARRLVRLADALAAGGRPAECDWTPRHPIHVAMVHALCNSGRLTSSEDKLLNTYRQIVRGGVFSGWAPFGYQMTSSNSSVFAPKDAQSQPGITSDVWVYARLARHASQPASAVERISGLVQDGSHFMFEITLLALPLAWAAWRSLRRRWGRSVPLRPRAPVLALAELFDMLIGALLMMAGISIGNALLSIGALDGGWGYGLALAACGPGLAYLLLCDALHLRYRRSIGKILFGLQLQPVDADPTRTLGAWTSVQRHLLLLPLALLVAMLVFTAAANADFSVLRFMLGVSWVVLTVWLLLLKGRGIGARWSRTLTVDVDSPLARARSGPARYLPDAVPQA